jgi:hypothetical protein
MVVYAQQQQLGQQAWVVNTQACVVEELQRLLKEAQSRSLCLLGCTERIRNTEYGIRMRD